MAVSAGDALGRIGLREKSKEDEGCWVSRVCAGWPCRVHSATGSDLPSRSR